MLVIGCTMAVLGSMNAEAASSRVANPFGIHAGLIGDPFPTLVGVNVNYNALDFLRLTAGYGSISATGTSVSNGTVTNTELSARTIGAGARLMIPDMNFTPVIGASFANVTITGAASTASQEVGGFSGSGSHVYVSGGFDWQAGNGFNLGFGYNYSLLAGVGGLPYVNLGFYF